MGIRPPSRTFSSTKWDEERITSFPSQASSGVALAWCGVAWRGVAAGLPCAAALALALVLARSRSLWEVRRPWHLSSALQGVCCWPKRLLFD